MRLKLPDVTLVAIDTVCHKLTWMAVDECLAQADFGDVQVFMNWKGQRPCNYIDRFNSIDDGLRFVTHDLPKHIKTSHVLHVQWDSWIIDPSQWTDEFLKYDWIGAPWWHAERNVGNSGFCLQSRELIEFFSGNTEEFPLTARYDDLICRDYQPRLPQFKWAPERLASQFSFERSRPAIDSRHFGYHGVFNWPFVMPPDRLAERMSIAREIPYLKDGLSQIDRIHEAHWHKLGVTTHG